MSVLVVLIVIGVGTYAMRSLLLLRSAMLPTVVQRLLPSVGPSVLAAIAVPGVLSAGESTSVGSSAAVVLAALASVVWWRRCRTFGVPLAVGLLVWWASSAVFSFA